MIPHFASVFVIDELEKFTSAGRGSVDLSKTVANRGFLETVCKMYRMLNGESVAQKKTPADKLRVLISRTVRYAKFAEEMTAIIQKKEGKGNAAALVTLMSDKKQLRIELEVAWFSCEYKDWSQTYNSYTCWGLGNKPSILQQLLGMDINRKAAVRAALEETYADAAMYSNTHHRVKTLDLPYLTVSLAANLRWTLAMQEKETTPILTMQCSMMALPRQNHSELKTKSPLMEMKTRGNAGSISTACAMFFQTPQPLMPQPLSSK